MLIILPECNFETSILLRWIYTSSRPLPTFCNATLISANRLKEMDAGRRKNNPKTTQI